MRKPRAAPWVLDKEEFIKPCKGDIHAQRRRASAVTYCALAGLAIVVCAFSQAFGLGYHSPAFQAWIDCTCQPLIPGQPAPLNFSLGFGHHLY